MKKPISILIANTDNYFTYGLRLGLQAFFHSRGQELRLFEEVHAQDKIDIVFLGNSVTCPPWLYNLHQQQHYPLVFLIKDRGRDGCPVKHRSMCDGCSAGTLYRHQDITILHHLLELVLAQQQVPVVRSEHRCQCQCMSHLTTREVDVLQCLSQGMNGRSTAAHLYISEKTVNAHKQSAMRKLNFRRNHELYYWLLQGGSHYLGREPSQLEQPQEPTSTLSPTQQVAREKSQLPFHRHRSTTYSAEVYVALTK